MLTGASCELQVGALRTLCPQAVGAGKPQLLGVYAQQAMALILAASLPSIVLQFLAADILTAMGESRLLFLRSFSWRFIATRHLHHDIPCPLVPPRCSPSPIAYPCLAPCRLCAPSSQGRSLASPSSRLCHDASPVCPIPGRLRRWPSSTASE